MFCIRYLLLIIAGLFFTQTLLADAPASSHFSGFVQNKGQWSPNILFSTELPQGWLFLEKTGFTYNFLEPAYFDLEKEKQTGRLYQGHGIKVELVRANSYAPVSTHQILPEYRNYYIGSDPDKWATKVAASKEIRYAGIFPKTDLKFYATGGKLKYDFVVQPGGNVAAIKMKYTGVNAIALRGGKLWVKTSVNEFVEETPYAYQVINGVDRPVPCIFTLVDGEVGFEIKGEYDHHLPLIIDPEVVFVSYTGTTTGISANCATADAAGNTYAAGWMLDNHYPVTVGAYQTTVRGRNVAISKFNPTGTRLLYATLLGGGTGEYPLGLVVTKAAELVVAGWTASADFPTSSAAYDRLLGNGISTSDQDFFVSKLSEDGTRLLASTYIGGTLEEGEGSNIPLALALDKDQNIILASSTISSNFPMITPFQGASKGNIEGVVAKFNGSLTSLLFSSYLGGSGIEYISDVKVGPATGHIYLVGNSTSLDFITTNGAVQRAYSGGRDGFAVVLDVAQPKIVASTFLGTNAHDFAQLITLDNAENVYVAGYTAGRYPVTAGVYHTPGASGGHFIHKLNNTFTATFFSTHLGNNATGPSSESIPTAFEVDVCENLYLTAYAVASNPVTPDALISSRRNLYLCQLSKDARQLVYGTYFGGSSLGHIHYANRGYITKNGVLYHIECTLSKTFAATPGAYSAGRTNNNDGIISKFEFRPATLVTANAVSPPVGCAPYRVQFENMSLGGATYEWDFKDGTPLSTEANPIHVFETPGKYKVQLTAKSANMCDLPATATIDVEVLRELTTPNIITPNGDGKNDTFVVKSRGENTKLNIYSRWGKLLFTDDQYKDQWDGRGLPDGTYYYSLEAPDACKPVKGWLEIVR